VPTTSSLALVNPWFNPINPAAYHPVTPTHQLLPANFRTGQLYRQEGARGRLSSVGWLNSDKLHRALRGRLAQQVAKVITYDTEYGFGLSERVATSPTSLEVSSNDRDLTLQRTSEEQTEVLTLFALAQTPILRTETLAQELHG
jgi:hypothetical protein